MDPAAFETHSFFFKQSDFLIQTAWSGIAAQGTVRAHDTVTRDLGRERVPGHRHGYHPARPRVSDLGRQILIGSCLTFGNSAAGLPDPAENRRILFSGFLGHPSLIRSRDPEA